MNPISILFLIFGALSFLGNPDPTTQPGNPSNLLPTPQVTAAPQAGGPYCLTKDEFDNIISGPVEFACDRTNIDRSQVIEPNVQWVKAASGVKVDRIFIHPEKILILKEICGTPGINYYTWKCHPTSDPEWGGMYANTMWKLSEGDPNRRISNGDLFDVYMRKDAKPNSWMLCRGSRTATVSVDTGAGRMADVQMTETLASSPFEGKSIAINGIEGMWNFHGDAGKSDFLSEPPRRKLGQITLDNNTYDVYVNALMVFGNDEDKTFYVFPAGKVDTLTGNETVEYDAFTILHKTTSKGDSLKLATFKPEIQSKPWYNVYIPESKPVIYLYPPEKTVVDVKIVVKNGYITVSDPLYDPQKGWPQLTVYPNGKIETAFTSYPYLYYETLTQAYPPVTYGKVVSMDAIDAVLPNAIAVSGMNNQEIKDFLAYWLPRLHSEVSTPYIQMAFIPQQQIEMADAIHVSVPIQSLLRVRAYFKPLKQPIPLSSQPEFEPFQRKNFTVVEWGGILDQ